MKRMEIDRLQPIIIGRQLDGQVETVHIDCRKWQEAYPALTQYRVQVTAPNGEVYLPAQVEMHDGVLVWKIAQSDTAAAGCGSYEIVATGADGQRKTSDHPRLMILDVMPGTADDTPPDYAKPWVEQVIGAVDALSGEVVKSVNGIAPDENGNVAIAGGSGVVVDKTLTIEGSAADAKTTGEKIRELSEDTEDLRTNVLNAGAGDAEQERPRIFSTTNPKYVLSVLPYRAEGYISADLAHTKENLAVPPFGSHDKSLYGLAIDADEIENRWHVYGTRTSSYSRKNYYKSSLMLVAGTYIFGADYDVRIDKSHPTNTFSGMQVVASDGGTLAKTSQHAHNITLFTLDVDTTVDVLLFVNSTYTLDAWYYPLLGRGEKLHIDFGQAIYGGTYNWSTGELISTHDSEGYLLETPVVRQYAPRDIADYREGHYFYTNVGRIAIVEPTDLRAVVRNRNVIYDSVQNMLEDTANVTTDQTCTTLGYYMPGDGGGGMYRMRKSISGDISDGGKIHISGGITYELITDEYEVNIKQYGAHGTGTDDTASIRGALSAYNTITIPAGTYLVSEPIVIAANKTVKMDGNATIRMASDTTCFVMRSGAKLIGGAISTYHLGNAYTSDVVHIVNDRTADLQYVLIRDTAFSGSAGNGVAIHLDSNASQVLYCDIDNANTYGYRIALLCDGERANSVHRIKMTANYANCAFYGVLTATDIAVSGETGLENDTSDHAIYVTVGSNSRLMCQMVDTGNPGHIPKSIYLSDRTSNCCITGINNIIRLIDDHGQDNFFTSQPWQNRNKSGGTIRNHRYNNLLSEIWQRKNVSVTLHNCIAAGRLDGMQYSDEKFINDLTSISPVSAWKFTSMDDSIASSVQIDILDCNIWPQSFGWEFLDEIGYGYGVAFDTVVLYGSHSDEDYEEIGRTQYNRDEAQTRPINTEITWRSQNQIPDVYKHIRFVLSFKATQIYKGEAYITSLYVVGKGEDDHQAFVQSKGSKVYGDLIYAHGAGAVLTAPSGIQYRLAVGDDGKLLTEPLKNDEA